MILIILVDYILSFFELLGVSVYISEMRYYAHYSYFSDYCPHLFRHVYHNVSAVIRSCFLQVVGMLKLTLYFAYAGRLFQFHEPCLMDVSYQLSPVNFPSESLHCLHRVLNSHFWDISLDQTDAFIHCAMWQALNMAQWK